MDASATNWLVFVLALVATLLVARWLRSRASRAARREVRPDVLDEGAAPARRNQALIDSASAAETLVPPPLDTMAGIGEVIAAAVHQELVEAEPEPEPEAKPAPEPALAGTTADDLSRIKGLGPKLQALLPTLGLSTFAQIAALDDAALDALDGQLGPFAGRPRRDSWVEQARLLAAGDTAGFEERFGKV